MAGGGVCAQGALNPPANLVPSMNEKPSSIINTACSWLLVFVILGAALWLYGQPGGPELLLKIAGYCGAFFFVLVLLILL